jgi:hypothetical protein
MIPPLRLGDGRHAHRRREGDGEERVDAKDAHG